MYMPIYYIIFIRSSLTSSHSFPLTIAGRDKMVRANAY